MSTAPLIHGPGQARVDVLGYALGAMGALLFSMKAILIKLAYEPGPETSAVDVDPITLLTLRMLFSVPFYAVVGIWAVRKWKTSKGQRPPTSLVLKAAGLGTMGYYLCAWLDFSGLLYITAQLERLLLFTYPAFVLILGAMFFGGRLTRSGIVSIVIAYAGIAVIFWGGDIATGKNVWLGSVLVLGAAFFFALYQLSAKRQINILGGALFTCVAMIAASCAAIIHFSAVNIGGDGIVRALTLPPRIYWLAAMIALVSTIIPSFMVNVALGRIGAQAVAILGMISPVATIFFAIWLLGEPFGFMDGLGTAITIFGIGLYTWFDRRSQIKANKLALLSK
jgi:drug/metabolite transporter (DMT)-like permease